ncbi:MAG: hypothetical protein NWQ45_05445 [Congregibacter sp.]|nr:hypothetical protein [Congregibacter sp.]
MSTSTFTDGHQSEALRHYKVSALLSLPELSTLAVGALSLWLVLAGVALANTTLALQHAWISGPSWQDSVASLALASLGVALIWRGLKVADPAASILGYAGGALLWMGFFEWTWLNFSLWLGVDPLVIDGQAVLPPSLLLVQASTFIFLPLMVLTAANKDTRCRMMLWIRRKLHLNTPTTSTVSQHSHHAARVSATETVFIIWFVYLLNIALYDPRLLGRSPETYTISVALIGIWAGFLVSRLLRIRSAGLAIRYAIPTGYLMSIPIDGITQTGLFPAFWIQPLNYPLSSAVVLGVFIACSYGLCRALSTSGPATLTPAHTLNSE